MKAPTLSEKDIQSYVVQYLELDGWRALRTDPVSRREWGKGFGEPGMADYLLIRYDPYLEWRECNIVRQEGRVNRNVGAQVLFIEFKRPGAKPRKDQLAWKEAEERRGGLVWVVDSQDAFLERYKASGLQRKAIS